MPPRTNPVPWQTHANTKESSSSESEDSSDFEDSSDSSSSDSEDSSSTSSTSTASDDKGSNVVQAELEASRADRDLNEEAARRADASLRYTDTAALWEALDSGNVRLVKMSFLIDKSKQSTVLQRRQDLPENAFVSPLFLKSLVAEASPLLSDFDGVLPIIAVSACWLSSSHPDPRGEQLRIIGKALEREAHKYRAEAAGGKGFSECGVFWDWVSLHQPEESGEDKGRRRPNEQVQYDSALRDMDLWFGHVGTVALLLTQPPVPSLEIVGNGGAPLGGRIRKKELRKPSRTYHRSGWTTYESTAAALKQFFRPRRHMQAATWQLVVECGLASADGEPPAEQKGSEWQFELTAADFGARLASKSFAHEADRAICVKLYERQVSATLGGLSSLVLQFPMPLGASPLPPVDAREATLLGRLADRKLCGRLLDLQLVRVPGLSDSFGAFCTPLIANGRTS